MSHTEVYRSPGMLACQQRAFVLHAVGIESQIVDLPEAFALYVTDEAAAAARHHIERYDSENTSESAQAARPKSAPKHFAHAWVTPLLYVGAVLLAAFLAGRSACGFDWYASGALTSTAFKDGEWWRIATALMLHADHAHLVSNLGFGAVFGFLAARLLGPGIAWGAMTLAALLGNLLDSVLMPNTHVAIGASTLVFATLGLVAAYSWRVHLDARMRWAHRIAPLVAGIALLGFLGTGGQSIEALALPAPGQQIDTSTDVLAHLTGFVCGAFLAIGLAQLPERHRANATIQYASGFAATFVLVASWFVAFYFSLR